MPGLLLNPTRRQVSRCAEYHKKTHLSPVPTRRYPIETALSILNKVEHFKKTSRPFEKLLGPSLANYSRFRACKPALTPERKRGITIGRNFEKNAVTIRAIREQYERQSVELPLIATDNEN